MAISFVNAGTVVLGTNPTVPMPSGIQENDYLLLCISSNVTPTTPSGWTLRGSSVALFVYSKIATGSESSVSVTLSNTSAESVVIAYRGVTTFDTANTSSTVTGTSITTNSLTTTYANEYVVSFFGSNPITASWTAPASTTTRVNVSGIAAPQNRGLLIVDELQSSAGASTARTATFGASASLYQMSISLVPSGRYWVGGTGTWDTTTTTNWSFSSGGVGGAPVPRQTDSVYFDQAGTYTVTLTGALNCFDLTISAGTVTTATGSAPTIAIYGSLSLVSGTVWGSGVSILSFVSTSTGRTITTNGTTISGGLTFNGVGGSWILQGAVTSSRTGGGAITLTNGTLDLNGYTATISASSSTFVTASGTKNLTFNGGTLAIASSGTSFSNASPTGFTTTAGTGTGTITMTSASAKTFAGGGSTFNCTLNNGGAGALTITGANTLNNITATYTSTATTTITFPTASTTTVNSFTGVGTSGKLLTLNSNTPATKATVALSGGGSVTTTDYLSITDLSFTPFVTDGSAPSYKWFAGANSINGGNVLGMLFAVAATAATVYVLASNSSWTTPADWNNSNNTIHLWGAGGGGSGALATTSTNHAGGAGGGGGGYTQLVNQTLSGSIPYSIGAGGTAGASAGGAGGTGGATTWNTTNTALGGGGGSVTSVPTSTAGLGGVGSTFNGGAGGAGATNTSANIAAGGGGGGAGGPNGAGGTGGTGTSGAFGTARGGSGGGNGGGTNGTSTGTGGNNSAGVGGGTGTASGILGGGGGGSNTNTQGGSGGVGVDILNSIGGGGGAGSVGAGAVTGTNNLAYAGGGSGGSSSSSTTGNAGGAGGQGLIVIVYTPSTSTSTGNFFFMF